MDILRPQNNNPKQVETFPFPFENAPTSTLLDTFLSGVVRPATLKSNSTILSISHYNDPIDKNFDRLKGYSRNWGDASAQTQMNVMKLILQESAHLPAEDQAILLATAKLESGFNPDAAATTSSATGVFQFIDSTGKAYGLMGANTFDAEANIQAGIQSYQDNLKLLNKRFPALAGNQRAAMIYAFHHDGPSLKYGGVAIAKKDLIPSLERYQSIVMAQLSEKTEH